MTRTGRIHIYYGYGKGKTTAAVGLAVRAAGSGLRVLVFQFMKDNASSERKILENLSHITCLPGRSRMKFANQMSVREREALACYNEAVLIELEKQWVSYDMLLLDESLCAVRLGLLSEERLTEFLERKPEGLEIILTGHEASKEMLERADYVTEMRKVKHPYDEGVTARKGIEY